MKLKDKRINNAEFEQVEKCKTCDNLFWAQSVYELDNWEKNCQECKIKTERKEIKRQNKIKKEGKPIKGLNGIMGWKLAKEELVNPDYRFSEKFKDIKISNIEDKIREMKKNNFGKNIIIKWHPVLFDMLCGFIEIHGFGSFLGKHRLKYMGIDHVKSAKTEDYILETFKKGKVAIIKTKKIIMNKLTGKEDADSYKSA